MRATYTLLLLVSLFAACQSKAVETKITARDTTITVSNSFSELFLDSVSLELFIARINLKDTAAGRLRSFYNSRNYQFAWFTNDGLAEQTRSFINLHNSYIQLASDSSMSDEHLHDKMTALLNEDTAISRVSDGLITTELELTMHFFKFAQHAYAGRLNPEELQWHIPRKKLNLTALLDTLIAAKGGKKEDWEPYNRQYRLLNKELLRLADIRKKGGWNVIDFGKEPLYKTGDSAEVIRQLKRRLVTERYFDAKDTSYTYSSDLLAVVKQMQKRYGIKQNGIVTRALINELNIPVKNRIEQVLINMERMRWMPDEPTGKGLIANIPDFKLHVFENSKKIFDLDIVVGTTANKTVIFSDVLQFVVFSPYWNVPPSIVRNEVLPAIKRNPSYLSRHNMEQTGTENGLPVIRQRPGGANALGKVKFVFPNNYNIYFHDTPAKSLFNSQTRAFSHGCIRVANPEKLAEYLLRHQPEWTADKMTKAMNATKENWVKLKEPMPVLITYFTAWVDRDGLLNFRSDIYGNDKKMAEHLFEKQP